MEEGTDDVSEFDSRQPSAPSARPAPKKPAATPGRATRTSKIQRKAAPGGAAKGAGGAGADAALETATQSSGAGLPSDIRGDLEGSLGASLADVRVHTGSDSANAAAAMGARAFTVGQDIHFGAGNFAPSSSGGRELIAHEVAHTVQQQGGGATSQAKLEVSQPGDSHEVEADRFAAAFSMGVGQLAPIGRGSVSGNLSRDAEEQGGGAGSTALNWVIDRIDDASSLVSALSTVSASMAHTVIRTIAARAPQIIESFIELNPTHALITYAIRQIPRDRVQALFARIDVAQVGRILQSLAGAGLLVAFGPLIFALAPERARQIIHNLDSNVVTPLFRAANTEAKQFVTQILNEAWPVGLGVAVSAGLGATFGYPIYVGGDALFTLSRANAENFEFRRRGEARVAADSGAGVGAFYGTGGRAQGGGTSAGGGEGASGIGVGASAGVQGQAGVKMIIDQKFGFPVFEDNAFLSMLVAVSGNDTSTSFLIGRMLFDCIADVDPMLYNTSTKFEAKLYAEGNAAAQAGLRLRDENTIEEPTSWSTRQGEGAASTGATNWWTRLLGLNASLIGHAGAEGGIGVEMQPHYGRDRSQGPESIDFELSIEASAALSVVHSIPWLSSHLPQLPSLDGAVGAKVRFHATPPPEPDGEPQLQNTGMSLYAKTGETDMYQGEASETEVSLNYDEHTFDDVEHFLASIQGGIQFFRRFSVGSTLGRKYMAMAGRQRTFNAMLPQQYRAFGFTLEGYLDFKCMISVAQARQIFRTVEAAVHHGTEGDDALQRMYADVLAFFNTGHAPAYVTSALTDVANTMLSGVRELKLHGQAGLRVAAGAQASEGAKVRLHGSAGGMITLDYDILQAIGHGSITVDDIQHLIEQGVDTARGYIEMGGDDSVDANPETGDAAAQPAGGGAQD